MLYAGVCNDALDNVSNSELIVPSSAQAMDAIDIVQRFVRLLEAAERALHALAEFEGHAQLPMCANTRAKHMDYFRN